MKVGNWLKDKLHNIWGNERELTSFGQKAIEEHNEKVRSGRDKKIDRFLKIVAIVISLGILILALYGWFLGN